MRAEGPDFGVGGGAALPFVPAPSLVPKAAARARPALTGPVMMPRTLPAPTILVFDSGLGGLTVYRLIAAHAPDLVVVACNTASTIALPSLRARFSVPFVGTVPAIKPACAASRSKRVSVLGTEATVKREYTRALIREFAAGCEVTLVGSARLAGLAEAELRGSPVEDAAIAAELAPCFVANAARTDTIVLACTHYPLLIERLERLALWPAQFIDPAPAIARRVVDLVGPAEARMPSAPATAIFTSGRNLSAALVANLSRFGIGEIATLEAFDTPSLSA